MKVISQFYGIIILIHYNEQKIIYKNPHIHIRYNNYKAIFDFNGNILEGSIEDRQKRMVEAWIFIHNEDLLTLWNVIQEGEEYFKIDPLK